MRAWWRCPFFRLQSSRIPDKMQWDACLKGQCSMHKWFQTQMTHVVTRTKTATLCGTAFSHAHSLYITRQSVFFSTQSQCAVTSVNNIARVYCARRDHAKTLLKRFCCICIQCTLRRILMVGTGLDERSSKSWVKIIYRHNRPHHSSARSRRESYKRRFSVATSCIPKSVDNICQLECLVIKMHL